ncbi:MAG TPA: PfkB family carbohydrate kinase [Acidimicrobiales bacterium]|nr:PfkB family carbohydrate kinase [Acidimicrobiales bacterium]
MAGRLVVLDSVLADVTLLVDAVPETGSDTRARSSLIAAGGGFNVAAAAVRQGMDALYGGRLGTGPFSTMARSALRHEGVGVALRPDQAGDIGVCLVLVDSESQRTFITAPGCELRLSGADLASLGVRKGDVLYLSGYNFVYPEVGPTVGAWLARLERGVVVAFDPGARVSDIPDGLLTSVLSRTDWVLASTEEARALTGAGSAAAAAGALARRSGRGAVVHDGERGCVVAVGEAVTSVPGYHVTAVDSNGAGDAHNGVFLAGLASGLDPVAAADRANGAAALAVTRLGPATSPSADELAQWFTQFAGTE